MQKLNSGEFTDLSESVVKTLIQNKVTTILEFLQEDVSKLSTISKLTLPQILNIRNEIFTKYSAPLINGTSLVESNSETRKFIKSGIKSLDDAIGNGIPTRSITEVCGLADSGKTQLSFQIAINCAKDKDDIVLYIDTKGDFSAVRIQKILDNCKYSNKDMAAIMFKIRIIHIWTMLDLIELFKSLKDKTLVIENLGLIIIDSLPCLMFQYLGDECKIGLTHLNTFVNCGRSLCRSINIAMICINIQTRWIDQEIIDIEDEEKSTVKDSYIEKRNRCLGKYWEQIPSLVLVTERLPDSNKNDVSQLKITVAKCNNVSYENRQCIVDLNTVGVT